MGSYLEYLCSHIGNKSQIHYLSFKAREDKPNGLTRWDSGQGTLNPDRKKVPDYDRCGWSRWQEFRLVLDTGHGREYLFLVGLAVLHLRRAARITSHQSDD